MSQSRKKRRADGSLRPTIVRRRARLRGQTFTDPRAEVRFRSIVADGTVIWNSQKLREQNGLDFPALASLMERLADEHRWAKLRDDESVVRAIGLPRNHPDLETLSRRDLRDAMLQRIDRGDGAMVA